MNNQLLKEYLLQRGVPALERNGEIVTHCLLNNCDRDSRNGEAHFYISQETGQWDCKKCGESGNVTTLAQKLKDNGDSLLFDLLPKKSSKPRFETEVRKNHQNLPQEVRTYLKTIRGWSDEIINQKLIGWVKQWGTYWIGFPIRDESGKYKYYKLREDYRKGDRKISSAEGSTAQVYDWEILNLAPESIVLCEGEGDCLLLLSKGVYAVTNTHGAGTFKEEWLQHFPKDKDYYIAYDTDEAGIKGAEKVASRLHDYGVRKVCIINLPKKADAPDQKVDITHPWKMNFLDPSKNEELEILKRFA